MTQPQIQADNRQRRKPKEICRRFIQRLSNLTQRDDGEARTAMAHLRHGLRGMPSDMYAMAKYVVPYLGNEPRPSDEWFYLVAALYADSWRDVLLKEGSSLGHAFHDVPRKDQNESLEKQFQALLNSAPDLLPDRLKQAIGLLKSRDTNLDWALLLSDLCSWDHPDGWVQRRWAHDFYYQDDNVMPTNGDVFEDGEEEYADDAEDD